MCCIVGLELVLLHVIFCLRSTELRLALLRLGRPSCGIESGPTVLGLDLLTRNGCYGIEVGVAESKSGLLG